MVPVKSSPATKFASSASVEHDIMTIKVIMTVNNFRNDFNICFV
ncbi:hypothetical protein ADIWIN_1559 [Winogradskyella psychrotolerans RS-3]|uniref:Uncharacterized protein n=1 Tax=Winogradskyella psychrotolerans RS-3 TaxID=641526 RepID=S7X3C9_9FLAO|nr:hypothetical protein ADIWIN_1559 [Winogradskyella psychrotolerans RS-3]